MLHRQFEWLLRIDLRVSSGSIADRHARVSRLHLPTPTLLPVADIGKVGAERLFRPRNGLLCQSGIFIEQAVCRMTLMITLVIKVDGLSTIRSACGGTTFISHSLTERLHPIGSIDKL